MNVKLIANTALSTEFLESIHPIGEPVGVNERAAIALTAIRTCYSPLKPTEIIVKEGAKYFGQSASDGESGTEADRLFRHITRSGHKSTLEHITYTFAIEGVSRALLAQLTRHRHLSFSVQSQRYVRFGSADKSGGFDYVKPPSLDGKTTDGHRLVRFDEEKGESIWRDLTANDVFVEAMRDIQASYDRLRRAGVPAEDARMVLPNAATCNLVMTGNLRTFLDFYAKRRPGNGAQWEIADLAVKLRDEIVEVDPWLAPYFDEKEAA
ncbi:FAD-dependent thymidylate synthase [Paenibacillus sediminis]|uniref:Flavin-dependent thymidylate synthase n=1 Tax=Paenibacillus sediminis TaxID=664909 RepID=A0ABS4H6J4_9BACL|nr:FAD-dependent thymidylate synthase [Paenibacillus sediminis]MBP1938163.1 thymidylate synthase (FAD) [Paenibacillus sediminis]